MAFDVDRVRAEFPGREILWLASTASTMADAARLAAPGVVVADEQTAGQGRFGRRWHSACGAGLWVSIALPPRGVTPALTLALGLAAAEAITAVAGVACDLRWPNDILLGGKKCGGVLVQVYQAAAVAGIGINVNQTAFPEELAPAATSLRLETGREHSREDLLAELLRAVDRHLELLARQGPGAVLDRFARTSSYIRGRRVAVEAGGQILRGSTDGLDPSGFLWLRLEDGSRRLILSGGVRPI
jgi:BirA family biotin operon repressor/biotin-[acetyl-CoA-carboxylase] ligase